MIHLYLDVDGVILPCSLPEDVDTMVERGGWGEYRPVLLGQFYAPAMLDALTDLGRRDDVTIHWTTTWSHHAPERLPTEIGFTAAVGWDVLDPDHAHLRAQTGFHGWWKREAVTEHMAAHRGDRFAWCDDDIPYDERTVTIVLPAAGDLLLAVAPDTTVGLTRAHLDDIYRFIDG